MEQQIREGVAKCLAMLLTPEAQQVLTASIMLAIALRGAWGVTMFTGRQTARAWRWMTTETPEPPKAPPPPLGRTAQSVMAALAGVVEVKAIHKDKDYDISNPRGLFATWRQGLESLCVKGVNCRKLLTNDEWDCVSNRVHAVISEHELQVTRKEENAVASSLGFLPTLLEGQEILGTFGGEPIKAAMMHAAKCEGKQKSA